MNNNLLSWLLDSGLDEKRAKLYLITLSRGGAQAKELAEELGMSRTAVYDNLRFLKEAGYVVEVHEGKRKVFVPMHPKELYKKVNNHKKQLKALLPDFMAVYADQGKQPFVQLYTGKHAAREIFDDILKKAPKEYMHISSPDVIYNAVDKAYIHEWVKKRTYKGIHSKSLRTQTDARFIDPVFTDESKYLREIRYLPEHVDLQAAIYIYGNNVGIVSSMNEESSCLIYSPNLAFSLKKIFNVLWNVSAKVPAKIRLSEDYLDDV